LKLAKLHPYTMEDDLIVVGNFDSKR
jgi:hypothetical protein